MRNLIVTGFMSLDGVYDSPGGGDHPHAGWTFKDVEFDEAAYEIKASEIETTGALLFGRRTYEEFAPVWPQMEEFVEYNAMPKYVVSSTLENPEWHRTEVLGSLEEVAELKRSGSPEDGDIAVHGSPTLAQGLLAAGLVDRYHLLVFPVLLGGGKRLFATDADKSRLRLADHAAYANGVTKHVYDVQN
jgi:dihydrofolate reductase